MKKIFFALTLYSIIIIVDYKSSINDMFDLTNRMSMSVRDFTSQQLSNGTLSIQNFPVNVPSHNAVSIMNILNNDTISYKEVSANPTNLNNKATSKELEVMNKLNEKNIKSSTIFDLKSMSFVQYRPIYMNQQSCLICHSNPNLAPKKQIEIYGKTTGYNYSFGDFYGAKVIGIDAKYFTFKHLVISILFLFLFTNITKRITSKLNLDSHTGVYNKDYYLKYKKIKSSEEGYLYVIDIDNFKSINDFYGHNFGDIVIKVTAEIIKSSVRETDLLFRIGGDEFLLFLPLVTRDKVEEIANKINKNISTSLISHEDTSIYTTVSIGYTKKHSIETFDQAFTRADLGLYEVKHSGRNNNILK